VALPRLLERREHASQRGAPEPAHGLRRELELALLASQVPLPLELALDPAQPLDVVDGLPTQCPLHGLLVDVGEARARVRLAQRLVELLEVRELLQRGR